MVQMDRELSDPLMMEHLTAPLVGLRTLTFMPCVIITFCSVLVSIFLLCLILPPSTFVAPSHILPVSTPLMSFLSKGLRRNARVQEGILHNKVLAVALHGYL